MRSRPPLPVLVAIAVASATAVALAAWDAHDLVAWFAYHGSRPRLVTPMVLVNGLVLLSHRSIPHRWASSVIISGTLAVVGLVFCLVAVLQGSGGSAALGAAVTVLAGTIAVALLAPSARAWSRLPAGRQVS